jgi:predicted RNA-binding Zn-ribbon protein involved in translation (DUF1610 family)
MPKTNYWFQICSAYLVRCLACGKHTLLSRYQLVFACPYCGFAGEEEKGE